MKYVVIFLALLGSWLFLIQGTISSDPYSYDEADYMYVASLGLVANYTDSPTMSIADFIRTGLTRGRDTTQRGELSELIRQNNDVVFYRHWHGPLYYYGLIPVSHFRLDERTMRALLLIFPVLSFCAIYLGCLWLLPGPQGLIAAVLSSGLFLWSRPVLLTSELGPHHVFVFCYLCSLVLAAKALATGNRTYWYRAVMTAGAAFCSLELAFVLIVTLVLCAYLERERLGADWGFAGKSVALLVATILVIWPTAILKLSFVKAYFFMAYLAIFRKSPWGNEGFLDTWRIRLLSSPVEWALVLLGLALFVRYRAMTGRRLVFPFVIYGLLAVAVTLRVTTSTAHYALVFEPGLDVAAGLAVAGYLASLRRTVAYSLLPLLCSGLLWSSWLQLHTHPRASDPRPGAILASIAEHQLQNKTLLVPQGDVPMIHYYFPGTSLRAYFGESPETSEFQGLAADAILYPGYPVRFEFR